MRLRRAMEERMEKTVKGLLAGALSLLVAACSSYADPGGLLSQQAVGSSTSPLVIYTNLGPGRSFDATQGWTINGYLGSGIGRQAISQQFSPGKSTRFGSAEVALSRFSGPGRVDVYLQQDASGLPGAVIEKIPLAGLRSTPRLFTATSTRMPCLVKGERYWLSVVAAAPRVLAGWQWNSSGDTSSVAFASTQYGRASGPWSLPPSPETLAAFQIDPAPSAHPVISRMIAAIEQMVADGKLKTSWSHGLIAKLRAIDRKLGDDRSRPACNQMSAFLHQVDAFARSGKLDAASARKLRKLGGRARVLMGCQAPACR